MKFRTIGVLSLVVLMQAKFVMAEEAVKNQKFTNDPAKMENSEKSEKVDPLKNLPTERDLASLPEEQRKVMEERIETMKKQFKPAEPETNEKAKANDPVANPGSKSNNADI